MVNEELLRLLANAGKTNDGTTVEDSMKRISDAAVQSTPVKDTYSNPLLSIGSDDKVEQLTKFSMSNDSLNWMLWLALYNDSWVFRRAIDKPAQDAIRSGLTITGDQKKLRKVYIALKSLRNDLINLLRWGALFGGSVACLMLDNVKDKDYAKPMNTDKLKNAKSMKLYVTDRWYGCAPSSETVTDMTDIDFGKPMYYNVSFPDGKNVRFHHSYVIRYEHRTAPQLVKSGMLQGWGYAEGAHIFTELSRGEKLRETVQSLLDKSLIEIIKMPGMRGIFMGNDEESNNQIRQRLEMVNWARNYNSLTFLDVTDEYEEHSFSAVGGLCDILQQNMWEVSAALDMQGILYGDLKNGWSNDTEALERYDQTINERCEAFVRYPMTKMLQILFARYELNEKIEFDFNSLLIKKQDKEKLESMKDYADFLTSLLNDGVIDTAKYAEALQAYINKGEIVLNFTEDDIKKLRELEEEESELVPEETEKTDKKKSFFGFGKK